MAQWDGAMLLARFKVLADRPSSDQSITDAQIYALLSEAQEYWYTQFAIHAPHVLLTAPTAMSTADSGLTYTFSGSIRPLYALIYTSATGDFLRPGSWDDPGADYVWEDSRIRMTRGAARTFPSSVPYSRHMAPPGQIDATPTEPTLKPDHARVLIVYHAVAEWARRGSKRDPSPFEKKAHELAWGVNGTGDIGILGALKMSNPFKGMEAFGQTQGLTGFAYLTYPRGY